MTTLIPALAAVFAASITAIVAWFIARRSAMQLERAAREVETVGIRTANNAETAELFKTSAAMREELRKANVLLQDQLSAIVRDNATLHESMHNLRNFVVDLQAKVVALTGDRDECRGELAEVLRRVILLEAGEATT